MEEQEKALVKSEVEDFEDFSIIRYAQVWKDADILLEDLGADSLDFATIICKVQKEFNVKFTREQKSDIKTIKDIIEEVKNEKE